MLSQRVMLILSVIPRSIAKVMELVMLRATQNEKQMLRRTPMLSKLCNVQRREKLAHLSSLPVARG